MSSSLDQLSKLLGEGDLDDDCVGVGIHIAASPGGQELTWSTNPPGDCRRIIRYTCSGHTVAYELFSLGAGYGIRRTRQVWDQRAKASRPAVDYSDVWRRGEADRWWSLLVGGGAK